MRDAKKRGNISTDPVSPWFPVNLDLVSSSVGTATTAGLKKQNAEATCYDIPLPMISFSYTHSPFNVIDIIIFSILRGKSYIYGPLCEKREPI